MKLAALAQPVLERLGFEFKTAPDAGRTTLFAEQAIDPFLKFITQIGDPDEILRQAGITRAKLRALTGDDEISGAMDTRRDAIHAIPWRLQPAGGDQALAREKLPEPIQWAWTEFEKHSERVLGACMEALPYGYSVQEAIYRTDPTLGRVTWAEITEKPFEWFIPRLDGTVLYKSIDQPLGEEVDARKFFLTARRQTYRNPYGDALFSRLYWVWFFRTNGWKFWVKWLERFGTPLLLGTTTGNAADMARALSLAVQDAAVAVTSPGTVSKVEQAGGAGHFENFEHACCARIVKLILGQTLTTDVGKSGGGSMAMAKIHNEVRQDKRDSDVRLVTKPVQRMIETLWFLNGFPAPAPLFVLQDETGLELDRATRDGLLMTAGLKLTPAYFAREYDFEDEDIDVAAMAAQPMPPFAGGQPPQRSTGNNPAKASVMFAHARFTPEQQAVERGIDEALPSLNSILTAAEINAAIRISTSRENLIEHLARLLPNADAAEFRAVVERALFAADVIGYAHATNPTGAL